MASGLNGQQFCFHGYLPIKEPELRKKLRQLDQDINRTGYTHIFIETPYRNQNMFQALKENISATNKICVAKNITSKDELILTMPVSDWKNRKVQMDKVPTIFLIGR
jgi:16S rRNA (cytidine1402-2'-O)-methyltransferase